MSLAKKSGFYVLDYKADKLHPLWPGLPFFLNLLSAFPVR